MNYLGYEWENQVSILASRITLYLQKEIKLSFLSTATVNALGEYDKEKKEWTIKGFCLSRYNIPVEVAEEMVSDLKCIHINRSQSSNYETLFAVCAYPTVMQAWYDMMREGNITMKLIRQVGGISNFTKMSEEDISFNESLISLNTPRYTADKLVLA
jgi:hypothetical protein